MNFPDNEKRPSDGPDPVEEPLQSQAAEPASEPPAAADPVSDDQVPPFPVPEQEPEFDFPRMEEDVAAFRRHLDEIDFKPAGMRAVDDSASRPASQRRRRRSNRLIQRPDASELGDRLESIAQRAAPTFDFFVFSFLCGSVIAVGYILDAPAILLLAVLVAPLMAPWVGTSMAAATGETRFMGQTLGGFLTSILMIFGLGLLGGFASRIFQPLTSSQAFLHARLWWPDLLMLILGTTILVVSFIQSEDKPTAASLMVAYEFFLPAGAAGFGLGSGVEGLWPQAGMVFLIHVALSLIISLLVFFYMGFRPLENAGYLLTGGAVVISLVIVVGFFGLGTLINFRGDIADATATPTLAATPVKASATAKQPTVIVPTYTARPVATSTRVVTSTSKPPATTPTSGLTPSPTLLPTPVYGRVQAGINGDGATVREEPGGTAITTVQNGYLVEFLPVDPVVLNGETWVKVLIRTPARDIEGWVLLQLIVTATPFGSP